MNWHKAMEEIKIRNFPPETASKDTIKRKNALKLVIGTKIQKDLHKIQERTLNRPLLIDVTYRLLKGDNSGSSKKDLDNLLKILFDVLSKNMVNGQNSRKGLGIMIDDSYIHEIKARKIEVNSKKEQGFDLMISSSLR